VPTSWDNADPTLDAGESTLSEGYDTILDCLPLGDLNLIYTESETWAQRYVGGAFIFNFYNLFRSSGILGQNCAANFLNRHFVVTQDDVIVHDGQQVVTKIDKRLRKWFFNLLSSTAFYTTLVVPNVLDREIWVCFSQGGGVDLNTALIWNWRDDTWAVRDLPDIRAAVLVPQALVGATETWDGLGGTWASPTGLGATWGTPARSAYSQSILMASPSGVKIINIDDTLLFAGAAYASYVEHTGLHAVAQDSQGRVVSNPNVMKVLRAIIPRASAAVGTVIDVSVGSRQTPTGAVTWDAAKQFIVGTDFKVDCYTVGRFLAVKFSFPTECKLQGYDLDVATLGLL
jgi:hypothetical protein